MTCDRAREYFSAYLEGDLDNRTRALMESHLGGCPACQEDTQGLRMVWADLAALPEVTPPPDVASHIMAEIRRKTATAAQAAPPAPSFLEWLRGLSPMRVGFAAGLATLVIAGTLVTATDPGIPMGWLPPNWFSRSAAVPPRVDLRIQYGATVGSRQSVDLVFSTTSDLPRAEVTLQRPDARELIGNGSMRADQPSLVRADLPRRASAALLRVNLASEQADFEKSFLCAVPFQRPANPQPLSLTFVGSLAEAARLMAEKTGRPVVLDAALENQPVNAQVSEVSPTRAWSAILEPLQLRVTQDHGTYRVSAAE